MKRLKQFGHFVMDLLRELGDENAYRRHLAAHNRAPSREEWKRFSDERLHARYIRPKCC